MRLLTGAHAGWRPAIDDLGPESDRAETARETDDEQGGPDHYRDDVRKHHVSEGGTGVTDPSVGSSGHGSGTRDDPLGLTAQDPSYQPCTSSSR